jgi:hypothetical protein
VFSLSFFSITKLAEMTSEYAFSRCRIRGAFTFAANPAAPAMKFAEVMPLAAGLWFSDRRGKFLALATM